MSVSMEDVNELEVSWTEEQNKRFESLLKHNTRLEVNEDRVKFNEIVNP